MGTIVRNFRLKDDLIKDLLDLAEKEGRTLNSFVAFYLQQVVNDKKYPLLVDLPRRKPEAEIKPIQATSPPLDTSTSPKAGEPITGKFEAYQDEIIATITVKELEAVMRRVKTDILSLKDKKGLEEIAKEHSKNMYTD